MKSELRLLECNIYVAKGLPKAIAYTNHAIFIIDVDTQQNIRMLNEIKEKTTLVSLYLSAVNVPSAAINFPKFSFIFEQNLQEQLKDIVESGQKIYDQHMEQIALEKTLSKEEAIEKVDIDKVPEIKKLSLEKHDKEEDDFDPPASKEKPGVSVKQAIYEDEDDFDDFEERPDLKKMAAEKPSLIKKKNEQPAEEEKKQSVYDILHLKNERGDKYLGQKEYVEKLDLDELIQAPIVYGKPLVYISITQKVIVDGVLNKYRISRFKADGLENIQIVKNLGEIKKKEDKIREKGLQQRENARLNLLKAEKEGQAPSEMPLVSIIQEETSKANIVKTEVSERKKKSNEFFNMLENEEQNNPIKQVVPKVPMFGKEQENKDRTEMFIKDTGTEIPKKGPRIAKDNFMENKEYTFDFSKIKKEPEPNPVTQTVVELKEEAKQRKLVMESPDDMADDLNTLFKKNRERLAREAEENIQKTSANSVLPNLPTQKLTDRNPMNKYTTDGGGQARRAESRTEIKSIRPPIEFTEEIEEKNTKKKGFFGFGKKGDK